jgi:hypothetical protein
MTIKDLLATTSSRDQHFGSQPSTGENELVNVHWFNGCIQIGVDACIGIRSYTEQDGKGEKTTIDFNLGPNETSHNVGVLQLNGVGAVEGEEDGSLLEVTIPPGSCNSPVDFLVSVMILDQLYTITGQEVTSSSV